MKKKLFWALNFTVLSLFTMSALGGVLGIGTQKAYAEAAGRSKHRGKSKHYVVVNRNEEDKDRERKNKNREGAGGSVEATEEVCSLSAEQAAQLDAFFKVKQFSMEVHGETVTMAAVSGRHLNRHQLKEFLRASDESLDCQVVRVHNVFFLPIMPHIS